MKNAWIVPVVVIALALITGGIVSLMPEKEILVEEIIHADTIVINSALRGSSPYEFMSLYEKYKIEVDWDKDLKPYIDSIDFYEAYKGKLVYGDLESREYENALFLFNLVSWNDWLPYSREDIELGVSKALYCKENNIRTIGINLITRINGVASDKTWSEYDTYEVISEIAAYMDILIIHYSENIDDKYYDLAEKNGVELIILGSKENNSTDYFYREIANYLRTLGI